MCQWLMFVCKYKHKPKPIKVLPQTSVYRNDFTILISKQWHQAMNLWLEVNQSAEPACVHTWNHQQRRTRTLSWNNLYANGIIEQLHKPRTTKSNGHVALVVCDRRWNKTKWFLEALVNLASR